MSLNGWLQIILLFAAVLLAVKPLGAFMARVFEGQRTFLSPVLSPVETGFYRLSGIDPEARAETLVLEQWAALAHTESTGFPPEARVDVRAPRRLSDPVRVVARAAS